MRGLATSSRALALPPAARIYRHLERGRLNRHGRVGVRVCVRVPVQPDGFVVREVVFLVLGEDVLKHLRVGVGVLGVIHVGAFRRVVVNLAISSEFVDVLAGGVFLRVVIQEAMGRVARPLLGRECPRLGVIALLDFHLPGPTVIVIALLREVELVDLVVVVDQTLEILLLFPVPVSNPFPRGYRGVLLLLLLLQFLVGTGSDAA